MLPVDRLTNEHRVIDQMLAAMEKQLTRMNETGEVDTDFVETAVEFLRIFADLLHHGKEEALLFAALADKPLSDEHAQIMAELAEQHADVRRKTTLLVAANRMYLRGSEDALSKVTDVLSELLGFYPAHVAKEEKTFFVAAMQYLSDAEKEKMLADMDQFDSDVIQDRYQKLVDALGGG